MIGEFNTERKRREEEGGREEGREGGKEGGRERGRERAVKLVFIND